MKARIVWLILCCIWGSTWLFIKIGLADLPPITFAGIRFTLASLILMLMVLARRAAWPRTYRQWALIAVVGLLQFSLNYGLGRAIHLFRSRSGAPVYISGVRPGHCSLLPAARASDGRTSDWGLTGCLWTSRDFFRPIEHRRIDGSGGQHCFSAERLVRLV